jgi:hypothetical protein
MAIIATPTEVILSFRDRENTPAKTRFFLPTPGLANVNAETIYAYARTLTPLVAALSDCQLTGMAVVFQDRDDAAVGAGEAERKGLFTFAVAGGTNYQTQVPGFLDALLDSDKRSIAVQGAGVQADVQSFLDAILAGPVGFDNGATNAAGISLVRAVEAHKSHVRSLLDRRGRSG